MPVTTVQKMSTVMIMVIMRMKASPKRLHGDGAGWAHIAKHDGDRHGDENLHPQRGVERLAPRLRMCSVEF